MKLSTTMKTWIAAMSDPVCRVCPLTESQHTRETTSHVFSNVPGMLKTWKEADRENHPSSGARLIPFPGANSPQTLSTDRLVRVLLEKGLITQEDALFILVGIRRESGHADPNIS